MPAKKQNTQSAAQTAIISDVLGLIGRPVMHRDLMNVLSQAAHGVFEDFTRLSDGELEYLIKPLLESGEVKQVDETHILHRPFSSDEMRAVLAKPEYAPLPEAISDALPIVSSTGFCDGDNLQRDLRIAFFSANTDFLNRTLMTMRQNFPKDYTTGARLAFLLDEPEEWLLSLPEPFLMLCAWKLVPVAMMVLHPLRTLAQKFYTLIERMQPNVLSAMIDYAILCGDWRILALMMRHLPENAASRKMRLGWIRFVSGRDDEAIVNFKEALDLVRVDAYSHNSYFRTIGGIFGIMALLREGSSASLQLAQSYAASAIKDDTPHLVIYKLLEQVSQAKANPDLPPFRPNWQSENRLNNAFACIAHYWLTGALDGGQRLLLESSAQAARNNGYIWLAEECEELLLRLHTNGTTCNRWHDQQNSRLPFMLDCVLTRNSWVERFSKLERMLGNMPARTDTRLAWFVNTEQASQGILTVKPIEQHSTKTGKWTKGRRFTAYRDRDYGSLMTCSAENEYFLTELTPQDKYACDILREAEDILKGEPAYSRKAWGAVMQALIGHPRLILENGETRPLHCIPVEPVVRVSKCEDASQYSLYPESAEDEDYVVRLERGDQICVYQFSPALKKLRSIFHGDFRIPAEDAAENQKVLDEITSHFRVMSDEPLEGISLPYTETDSMPCIQLVPRERGLHVEIMVRPFGVDMQYYQPGEGPLEFIYQDRGTPKRLVRSPELERQRAEELIAECPRLAAGIPDGAWQWNVEGLACYELTLQLRGLLDKCHVQWPSDQKFVCHRTLSMSNISLHTQSYLSWFSVEGEVHLDDTDATASLSELIQAAGERKNFITLSDGQVVALSEGLRKHLEELGRLGDLVRESNGTLPNGSLRICRFLLPFLSESIAEFPGAELPPESNQWIQQYNSAMELSSDVPEKLNVTLRPYQETGFQWLSRLDAAQAGACLADDMGLGKTVQAIALIMSKADDGPSLIVAPTSVCANWHAEFSKFAPELKCQVFGPGDRIQAFSKLGPGHVMITSYGLLQSEQKAFGKIQWRVAVLDEAQAIKNAHAKRSQAALEIHADFRIVTTGTPVENNLSELWSIFNFIIPGLLGSRENFQRRFAAPIEHENDANVAKNLRGIVSPFLLRRRKDQVLHDLPPKEEIDYPVELTAEERAFYDNLRKQILADLEAHEENDGQRHIRVLAGITKLRLAVDHPRLVTGGENLQGAKLEAFLELLRRILSNGHKVLVFSQFVKFLEIVRETLDGEGINYEYLDGARTPKERAASVDNFQNGDVPVFLISLKAGGLGLNLTQADYVIHLDSWWNPAVENQASDRAHRLGQNKKVTIYHLQTVNTIEDKIKALHKRKLDLADNLLADADSIETTPLEELLKLLREG
ncbi:MAG: DEAD/DEAH box helicase [Lentisphaeria bacterium]|nr:DEAD/DEAH box helicase [Lentisphaeria bacterium]